MKNLILFVRHPPGFAWIQLIALPLIGRSVWALVYLFRPKVKRVFETRPF